MQNNKVGNKKNISRREFLKDATIVVGGTAVSSAFFLSACGKEIEVTKTVTTTKTNVTPGLTNTVTATAPGVEITKSVVKYICPACDCEFSTLNALKAHFDAAYPDETSSSNNVNINILVNGKEFVLSIPSYLTLAEVLRNKLGLTGTKIACDAGACGACTVIVDGKPVLSCMVLAIECDGKVIETVESLKQNGELSKLQKSFVSNDAMQCGFCTSGMLMSAHALLRANPSPMEDEIRNALAGNLCRCGAYKKIVEAVQGVE